MKPIHITDHAMLRYLERAHGLDIEAVRLHLEKRAVNAVRLGAVAVTVENVKLVIEHHKDESATVTTALRSKWHSARKMKP
ncbi:hypothetical protein [Aliihoeflea sp. PC F10.4]